MTKHLNLSILNKGGGAKFVLFLLFMLMCLPAAVHAEDTVFIGTLDDWKSAIKKYKNTKVTAYLTSDITLDNTSKQNWCDFTGTFDGQGYTININYSSADAAPFENVKGTAMIKNVRIAGSLYNTYGSVTYDCAAPLVLEVPDGATLTVLNCLSEVNMTVYDSRKRIQFGNFSYTGGFISKVKEGGTVFFNTCAFTGSLISDFHASFVDCGGFVGHSDGYVRFYTCWSAINENVPSNYEEHSDYGYFIGELGKKATTVYERSYAKRSNLVTRDEIADANIFNDEQIKSGEVTWILNGGKNTNTALFVQNIPDGFTTGQDTPQMAYFKSGKKVYRTEVTVPEGKKWATGIYVTKNGLENPTLPDGVVAYKVTGPNDKGELVLTQTDILYNTPVLLYCKDGFSSAHQPALLPYTFFNDTPSQGTLLTGVIENTVTGEGQYVLTEKEDGTWAFVKSIGSTVSPFGCYLSGDALTEDEYSLGGMTITDWDGHNLVKNGTFEGYDEKYVELAYWEGLEWPAKIYTDTEGTHGNYWTAGTKNMQITQTINLTDFFSAEELKELNLATMSCDVKRPEGSGGEVSVMFDYYDAGGNVLKKGWAVSQFDAQEYDWTTFTKKMVLPEGVRSVKVTVRGISNNYGAPCFDNISLELCVSDTVKTVVAKPSQEGGGTVTGSGRYFVGSSINLDAQANDGYTFMTWDENDKFTDAFRGVDILSDTTFVAMFKKPNPATFTKKSNTVDFDIATNVYPQIPLPDDYTGEITWSSSDETLATVNENGTVTYTGEGKKGKVAIIASLPEDYNYLAATDSCTILFVNGTEDNLVVNGAFNDDYTAWTGKGNFDNICDDDNEAYDKYWRAGPYVKTQTQTINLDTIFTAEELAGRMRTKMMCDVSAFNGYRRLAVVYTFLGAAGDTLKTVTLINDSTRHEEALEWTTLKSEQNLPANIHSVVISLTGMDLKQWSGQYGPGFDNVYLSMKPIGDDCYVTVKASPEEGGEVIGTGVYSSGTELNIATQANEDYTFLYWDDDKTLTETKRTVVVNSDTTITAVFKKILFAAFEKDVYTVQTVEAAQFESPVVVLPIDYKGKAVWTSSDTYLATVASDGTITYTGDGKKGTVTITVVLSEDELYAGDTASYSINFVRETEEGDNLVVNGTFTDDFYAWDRGSRYGGIYTDGPTVKYWRTNYHTSVINQTIDLYDYFTEDTLSTNEFEALMSCDVAADFGHGGLYVTYKFYDTEDSLLRSVNLVYEESSEEAFDWKTVKNSVDLPDNARKVIVTLRACDYKNWSALLGPGIDNVSLKIYNKKSPVLGVSKVTTRGTGNGAVYDLEGRKVQKLQKGQIYIQNGKKFIAR